MDDLYLEFCSSSDIVEFEQRHYVAKMPSREEMTEEEKQRITDRSKKEGKPRGHHGQQIHFLIWYRGEKVGVISGGSPVFATGSRDDFFGITKANRQKVLNGIIDNTVFRLEKPVRNLATRILSLWRKQVVAYWEYLYDVKVFGFETFVEFETLGYQRTRTGALYRADNWSMVGETSGSTKNHIGVGLTGGQGGKGSFARVKTKPKIIFCKWLPGISEAIPSEYKSSWKAATKCGTPEEKALAKLRQQRRQRCMGTKNIQEVLTKEESIPA